MTNTTAPSAPEGVTGKLSNWITSNSYQSISADVTTRAKYLLLDGIACALVGCHLPWSETAARGITSMDPAGDCTVIGWGGKKLPPLSATLLNSTFIQGFELDDYHSVAPLHSNSLLIPPLFAAIQHFSPDTPVSGKDFLTALITGYEVGPRVGLALHGPDLLSRGWHSGAVQGPSASAAAISNLLHLTPAQTESALGTACTQAGGLMSAQFGSEVKRMQHGFPARNGLFAAVMAKENYKGIEQVYEVPYGGFLACFSQGANFEPKALPEELVKGLGEEWRTWGIRVKLHAAMAALHAPIDCVAKLQEEYPERFAEDKLDEIESIVPENAQAAYEHGGWTSDPNKPVTSLQAQMSIQYAVAAQLVDREVLMAQFSADRLNRESVRGLMAKVEPKHNTALDAQKDLGFQTVMTVNFTNGGKVTTTVKAPKGIEPACSNEDVVQKWRALVRDVLDDERMDRIEKLVLGLEDCDDVKALIQELEGEVPCAIEI